VSGSVEPYRFILFVVGNGRNSQQAQENLNHICAEHLRAWRCEILIVDVQKDFQMALDYNILVTPTLVVQGPRGLSTIIGNLSEVDSVLMALGPY
jgi:circadian clock protein KaiB